jgi:hypothetical protein
MAEIAKPSDLGWPEPVISTPIKTGKPSDLGWPNK